MRDFSPLCFLYVIWQYPFQFPKFMPRGYYNDLTSKRGWDHLHLNGEDSNSPNSQCDFFFKFKLKILKSLLAHIINCGVYFVKINILSLSRCMQIQVMTLVRSSIDIIDSIENMPISGTLNLKVLIYRHFAIICYWFDCCEFIYIFLIFMFNDVEFVTVCMWCILSKKKHFITLNE